MEQGYNKANVWEKLSYLLSSEKGTPCVFLSHIREDKSHCRAIGRYLKEAGINYYLDENDNVLQQASSSGDYRLVTESLKKGIRESTHMLVVVSESTYKSHWVTFEIGYGHAEILDKGLGEGELPDKLKLSILTLKDLSESDLPDYLLVGNLIRGTKSLNEYILSISLKSTKVVDIRASLKSNNTLKHPLDPILNWKL